MAWRHSLLDILKRRLQLVRIELLRAAAELHALQLPATAAPKPGILAKGHVRPTLEVVVTESPAHLRKVKDTETALRLSAGPRSAFLLTARAGLGCRKVNASKQPVHRMTAG